MYFSVVPLDEQRNCPSLLVIYLLSMNFSWTIHVLYPSIDITGLKIRPTRYIPHNFSRSFESFKPDNNFVHLHRLLHVYGYPTTIRSQESIMNRSSSKWLTAFFVFMLKETVDFFKHFLLLPIILYDRHHRICCATSNRYITAKCQTLVKHFILYKKSDIRDVS